MKQFLLIPLINCYAFALYAQTPANNTTNSVIDTLPGTTAAETSHAKTKPKSIVEANVFILNTQDPSVLEVYKNYDPNNKTVVSKHKLEIKSRQTTAFKITNINPLRYNYYLNGQLVTQFMENSPASVALGELAGASPVSDIVSLDVFTLDKEVLNQKNEIDKAKEELKTFQKNLEAALKDLSNWIDSSRNIDTAKDTKFKTLSLQYDKKISAVNVANAALTDKLADLNLTLNKLAINANSISIITNLSNSLAAHKKSPLLVASIDRMVSYIEEYLLLVGTCKEIRQELSKIPQRDLNSYRSLYNYLNDPTRPTYDLLTNLLNEIGYPTDMLIKSLTSNDPQYVLQQPMQLFRIEEYITDKKISSLGNLLTELYLEVGKLLQDSYIESSRQLNRIKNLNYITAEDELEVQQIAKEINSIFSTIQTVNAHVSVLTVFMQINNAQSKDLGKSINSLYKSLLNFLKVTDYIKEGTTNKYTLAMHANGSNIDLIRYTVKQEDVQTKNTQSYVYDIWLKGGLKIDFSLGIFASGLKDEAYEKKPVFLTDSTQSNVQFSLAKKDQGRFGFSFGGMVNISPRLGASWITPGISLGIAYGDNQNLQFMAAGSLHLGKSERILLHGGYVMGQTKVLDKSAISYTDATEQYVRGNINNYAVPLTDKFRGQFFFGISYNLSKKNALQAVSGQGLTKFNSQTQAVP